MNTFIALKKLWYGDVLKVEPTKNGMENLVANMTEVTNIHGDTWSYEESDPEKTEYTNLLTGINYYVDMTKAGAPQVNFTLGEYEYQQKADLQGGTVIMDGDTAIGWKKATELGEVHKSIVALSKTGVYIIFPKAQIIAKGDVQEKNIGLGVQAIAVDPDVTTMSAEYWIKG